MLLIGRLGLVVCRLLILRLPVSLLLIGLLILIHGLSLRGLLCILRLRSRLLYGRRLSMYRGLLRGRLLPLFLYGWRRSFRLNLCRRRIGGLVHA